jgi:hypothetical protein
VEPGTFPQATAYEKDYGRRSAQGHFPQSFSAARFAAAASWFFDLSFPLAPPAVFLFGPPAWLLVLPEFHPRRPFQRTI